MREFHGQDAYEGTDTGTDSGADASERHVGDSRQGRVTVQDAETRIALALAHQERVEIEYAACDPGQTAPQGDQGRHSPAATRSESDHASHVPAEQDAESRDVGNCEEQKQSQDKDGQAARGADLPSTTRDLPDARDVLPNIRLAELDDRKFSDYSLKPDHPGNNGKADGWRALGYDVDNPQARRDAARELRGLICEELLARGKVAGTRDTEYGLSHTVLSGLVGPNGRHATLVTCWLIEDRAGLSVPRLTTTWVQPHRDKETER